MKKLFKAAASLTVGCALLSTSAFAALDGSVNGTETGATVSLTGYAEKAQSTILVLKGVEELSDDIAESAIAYINQAEATNGTITYDVKVSGDGKYTVFVGGSDQTEAKKLGSFVISSVVDVTGITLAIEELTADENGNFATELTVGDTLTVNATVAPDNATDKTVTWTSSNADVATVEGGVVTTKAAGDVVITATAGSFSKTVTIKVNEKAPANDYITTADTAKATFTAANYTFNFASAAKNYKRTVIELNKAVYANAGNATAGYVITVVDSDGNVIADAQVFYSPERKKYVALFPETLTDYKFKVEETGTANETFTYGNANMDSGNVVNNTDKMQIVNYIKDSTKGITSLVRSAAADVNSDGRVNNTDKMQIVNLIKARASDPNAQLAIVSK